MTKKERFNKLAELGCVVCRTFFGIHTPCQIHHLTGIKYRSTGKKASDEHTIGLCSIHHQNGTKHNPGIHTHPELFAEKYGSQENLLDITNGLIK